MRPRAAAVWAGLAPLLALFLAYLAWLGPGAAFGRYHDDTLYLSAAKAIAEGQGQVLPSVPGQPAQTKYPPLYSWLLSVVWRLAPPFPASIGWGVWMTAAFSCWFLVSSWRLLAGLKGVGGGPALAAVALCAFHPNFLYLSGALLSDVPFLALAMAAALAADAALRQEGRPQAALAAGLWAGLAVLTRGFGVAVVAGIVATALLRRAWRQGALFLALAAPLALAGLWNQTAPAPPGPLPGFQQTWLYYTSYSGFWKASVPGVEVLAAMLQANLRLLLEAPATLCLFPPLGEPGSFLAGLLTVTLSAGILSGVVRQARRQQWKPIHFVLVFYAGIVALWNYPLVDRFLVLFLPLLYAGLWVEARHFASLLAGVWRWRRPLADRVIAAAMAAGLAAVGVAAVERYARGDRSQLRKMALTGAALAAEKQQLYDWVRRNTSPRDRFIAYQDVELYLHTGRQAMRPMAFSTAAFFTRQEKYLEQDLDRLLDTARVIGARYWVKSANDFQLETGLPLILRRVGELEATLPEVFRTTGGRLRVYELALAPSHTTPDISTLIP